MNNAEIQRLWFETYRQLEQEAERYRNSQMVSVGMLELYDTLGVEERQDVHLILEEWLVSDDNKKWYDAKFIISQRKIRALRAAVERAIRKFAATPDPEAHFAVEDLRRIMRVLD